MGDSAAAGIPTLVRTGQGESKCSQNNSVLGQVILNHDAKINFYGGRVAIGEI